MMLRFYIAMLLVGISAQAMAMTFSLPATGDDLVGMMNSAEVRDGDTFVDLARAHDLGYENLERANPGIDPWIPPPGTRLQIPQFHVLPDAPRQGVVINLAELRLYYFRTDPKQGAPVVGVYPIGIGRDLAPTPIASTRVVAHIPNPVWYPPASIRDEHAENDKPLPAMVAAGPNNPLGQYALKLDLPGYFIHGTNKPYGIGMRVSHGCIRLYPEDIKQLFGQITNGTTVTIVDQPYKAGWYKGRLYFEAYPPLAGTDFSQRNLTPAIKVVMMATQGREVQVDWDKVTRAAVAATGIPAQVSR